MTLMLSHLDADTVHRLTTEAKRRGVSTESLAADILSRGTKDLPLLQPATRSSRDSLMALAGVWSDEEYRKFMETLSTPLHVSPEPRSPDGLYHDLDHLAGTWSEEEAEEFRRNTECFNQIDPELWS